MLRDFLPHGEIWNTDPGRKITAILEGLDPELDRVASRNQDLLAEFNPRNASETLASREEEAGLPDTCTGILSTVQERRNALVSRWALTGGGSRAYLIASALNQGFAITIDDGVTDHVFTVHGPTTSTILFRTGDSSVGEALNAVAPNIGLECLIDKIKPAQTRPIFVYDL